MPPPDRVLNSLKRAIELVKATPGRRGHLVDLQNCDSVFAVGDLHGHIPNFQAIWKLADLGNNPRRHLVLQELIHGKYLYANGGEKLHQLVDLFAMAKTQYPERVHYIPGNHEMGQWTGRKILKGDADLNEQYRLGVLAAYGEALMPEIYKTYFELFQSCPLILRTSNHICLSHTLPPARHLALFDLRQVMSETYQTNDLEPGGYAYNLVWGRDTSEENAIEYLRKVECDWLVTGHIPADAGYTVPNSRQVTLDCSNAPGGYMLVPADRPLIAGELTRCIGTV